MHSPSARLRVAIAHSAPVARQHLLVGLHTAGDLEAVGDGSAGLEVLSLLDDLIAYGRPPQVLMLELPDHPDCARALVEVVRERHPEIAVVGLAGAGDSRAPAGAMAGGASGCVREHASPNELSWAARWAARGRNVAAGSIAHPMMIRRGARLAA